MTGLFGRILGRLLNADDPRLRARAVRAIRDQSRLQELVDDRGLLDDVRLAAAGRLRDPAAAQAAYHTLVSRGQVAAPLQLAAVARLTDQTRLRAIATDETGFADVRLAAAEKLADPAETQAVYQSVAANPSTPPRFRLDAAERLADPAAAQAVYYDLAQREDDDHLLVRLRLVLTPENLQRVAADPATPRTTACTLAGHQLDPVCTCKRCGRTNHDWETSPNAGVDSDFYGTCRRCGAERHKGYRTLACWRCDGKGQREINAGVGGTWTTQCDSCGGTGERHDPYDTITYRRAPDGLR